MSTSASQHSDDGEDRRPQKDRRKVRVRGSSGEEMDGCAEEEERGSSGGDAGDSDDGEKKKDLNNQRWRRWWLKNREEYNRKRRRSAVPRERRSKKRSKRRDTSDDDAAAAAEPPVKRNRGRAAAAAAPADRTVEPRQTRASTRKKQMEQKQDKRDGAASLPSRPISQQLIAAPVPPTINAERTMDSTGNVSDSGSIPGISESEPASNHLTADMLDGVANGGRGSAYSARSATGSQGSERSSPLVDGVDSSLLSTSRIPAHRPSSTSSTGVRQAASAASFPSVPATVSAFSSASSDVVPVAAPSPSLILSTLSTPFPIPVGPAAMQFQSQPISRRTSSSSSASMEFFAPNHASPSVMNTHITQPLSISLPSTFTSQAQYTNYGSSARFFSHALPNVPRVYSTVPYANSAHWTGLSNMVEPPMIGNTYNTAPPVLPPYPVPQLPQQQQQQQHHHHQQLQQIHYQQQMQRMFPGRGPQPPSARGSDHSRQ